MRLSLLVLFLLWAIAEEAPAANDTALQRLGTSDAARQWEAVGRINLGNRGFCTGALIRPDLVLTAAHCMFDKRTGKRIHASEIEFLAGWRDGRAAAQRRAKRTVVHEKYDFLDSNKMGRVGSDIALIELDLPIQNSRIQPFTWEQRPSVGAPVQLVSYSQDRAEAPSLQEICSVLDKTRDIMVLSCEVDFGASGAPIFTIVDGVPYIASIVSAKAEWKNRHVALGASLGRPLTELIQRLADTDGVFQRIQSTTGALGGGSTGTLGSKFIKP